MELAVLLLLAALAFWAQGKLFRRKVFQNLDYSCSLSKNEVYENDEIELTEVVSNHKLIPVPWLKADITTSRYLEFSQMQSSVTDQSRFVSSFFMMKSYQRVTRTWKVRCAKRGIYPVERVVLVTTGLLGGGSMSQVANVHSKVTVLPCALDLEESFTSSSQSCGDVLVRRFILPDPFYVSGVREYAERDPVNHIHWAATAKEGRVMVYNNDYTSSQSQAVILNMQTRTFANAGAVNTEQLENAVRACAALFQRTLDAGVPLRFLANMPEPVHTQECWGGEHLLGLLELLAGLDLKSGEHFPFYLNGIYDEITATDIALVSCYLDDAIVAFASEKARGGTHVQLFILDPDAVDPCEPGLQLMILREPAKQQEDCASAG